MIVAVEPGAVLENQPAAGGSSDLVYLPIRFEQLARKAGTPRLSGMTEFEHSGAAAMQTSCLPRLPHPDGIVESKCSAGTPPRVEEETLLGDKVSRGITGLGDQELKRSPAGVTSVTDGPSRLSTVRASDVSPQPLRWLWLGWIASGKLTLLVGDPGLGKSGLAAGLASVVSRGAPWPVTGERAPKGSVLIVSTEDDPFDTIIPRLQAAGADTTEIHLLGEVSDASGERGFDLTRDLPALEEKAGQIGNLQLVIIDPVTACLGRINQNSASAVRAVLTELARFAARTGVAVLCVSHLNKSNARQAMKRALGSLAFVAVARSALLVTKDPSDPSQRLLLPIKNNLGLDDQSLPFRIETVDLDVGAVPRVVFADEFVTTTADEALNDIPGSNQTSSALEEAKAFLLEHLPNGPLPATAIQAAAQEAAISNISLRRAKDALADLPLETKFNAALAVIQSVGPRTKLRCCWRCRWR